jgi:hypothetical protein
MIPSFFREISAKSVRVSLFVFSGLLFFSMAFFVLADDSVSGKNIFQDSDGDGLSNDEESLYGTDPYNKDSDGDGYSDGVEVLSGYNPLKKAPGDKIVTVSSSTNVTDASANVNNTNLTEQVSNEIAKVIKNSSGDEAVSVEQVNTAVQNIMNGSTSEVILPEINMSDIKIKKSPSKKLGTKAEKEAKKEDATEYLTSVSYLIANNSPTSFHTGDDFSNMLDTLSSSSISALASGDMSYLDQLSDKGDELFKGIKDIEVPEEMLDVHIKALRMALYASQLKNELKPTQDDPIGQIAILSKAQGFIGASISFSDEVSKKLSEYGIDELPINL